MVSGDCKKKGSLKSLLKHLHIGHGSKSLVSGYIVANIWVEPQDSPTPAIWDYETSKSIAPNKKHPRSLSPSSIHLNTTEEILPLLVTKHET